MPAKPQRMASKRNYEGKSPETKTRGAIAGKEHCSSKELPEVFCSTVGYALLVLIWRHRAIQRELVLQNMQDGLLKKKLPACLQTLLHHRKCLDSPGNKEKKRKGQGRAGQRREGKKERKRKGKEQTSKQVSFLQLLTTLKMEASQWEKHTQLNFSKQDGHSYKRSVWK